MTTPTPNDHAWRWIPSLYFIQGLPYVVAMGLSVVLYKNLGLSNTEVALYTSWLYLPWVIKPLWSPLVELLGRKRLWVIGMQALVGMAFALVAFSLPAAHGVQLSLALFFLVAMASATHDIAADGFYMLALSERRQAAFVGVRSLFYRLANIGAQGGLVMAVGWLAGRNGSTDAALVLAWQQVFGLLAAAMLLAALWHARALPKPASDRTLAITRGWWREALQVFALFFRRPDIGRILAFLLLYRFAEAQLLKLVSPFLLDPASAGGLALSNQQVGVAYGTVGVTALTLGGLLGGWLVSRVGLKRALWPLMACLHLPNLVYVALALAQPAQLAWTSAAIGLEQFGYGLGFTAYMVFMLMVAERDGEGRDNPHKTAHYALCTGFMALGMMLPGFYAGWLQQQLGYLGFFVWVCASALPSVLPAIGLRIDPAFGRRESGPG